MGRSVRPGVLELTVGAGSLEGRCPRSLLVDDEVGVGDVEGVVVAARLDTEDWAEWPSLDCDLLNLDRGAPLSETVSRWVECVLSWPDSRGIRVRGDVDELVKVKVVAGRRVGLVGHSVLHLTLGFNANLPEENALPLSISIPLKKSSASDDCGGFWVSLG